jgi:16S rRNA (adenine(1408)-N(1))-methyltransferase
VTVHEILGKKSQPISHYAIASRRAPYEHCIIEIGAGDGKGSLRLARSQSQSFVIALDSNPDALRKTSSTAAKKTEKGGVRNLLCLYGNIRDCWKDLQAIANEITIILPWGDLLEGIAERDDVLLNAISGIAQVNCRLVCVINGEIWKENLPSRLGHLGEIAPEFFTSYKSQFEASQISFYESHLMSDEEISNLQTTWTAKLMSSREHADFIMATGVVNQKSSSMN